MFIVVPSILNGKPQSTSMSTTLKDHFLWRPRRPSQGLWMLDLPSYKQAVHSPKLLLSTVAPSLNFGAVKVSSRGYSRITEWQMGKVCSSPVLMKCQGSTTYMSMWEGKLYFPSRDEPFSHQHPMSSLTICTAYWLNPVHTQFSISKRTAVSDRVQAWSSDTHMLHVWGWRCCKICVNIYCHN